MVLAHDDVKPAAPAAGNARRTGCTGSRRDVVPCIRAITVAASLPCALTRGGFFAVRLGAASRASRPARVEAHLQGGLVKVRGQRPGKPQGLGPLEEIAHGAVGYGEAARDLAPAQAQFIMKPQNLFGLAHG